MALIIEGSTKCALCEKVLQHGEQIMGLPPITNTNHELYIYFDRGFHLSCFESWDRKEEILQVLEKERKSF